MSKEELINKVKDLQELKVMVSTLQGEITSIEDEIKAEMSFKDNEKIVVDIFEIKYKKIRNHRFDVNAFATEHKELYKQFIKTTEIKQLSII